MIQEDFLQLGWKTGIFLQSDFVLTDGRKVEIINKGTHNLHGGPDFSQGKIRIEDTIWAGNIEFHVKSSDWEKHGHSNDSAYNNVILHVVWEHDLEIKAPDGSLIPCLELKNYIPKNQLNNYFSLIESLHEIPCQERIRQVDSLTVHNMLQRAVVNRIERKSERIAKILSESQNDWQKAFFVSLFRNFGFKTNQVAFEELASRIPVKVFDTLKDKPLTSEALLLGSSGLLQLEKNPDPYIQSLLSEYEFLQHKYKLNPMPVELWKFSKLRPHNIPFVRMAQLASLLNRNSHLFSRILEAENVKELISLFSSKISEYWIAHYKPGIIGKIQNSNLSKDAIDLIIVNTCVPIVFMFGRESGNNEYCEKALAWLEAIKPENNSIISYWKSIGIKPQNCYESQGLLELKEVFCQNKKCLDCQIGFSILNK